MDIQTHGMASQAPVAVIYIQGQRASSVPRDEISTRTSITTLGYSLIRSPIQRSRSTQSRVTRRPSTRASDDSSSTTTVSSDSEPAVMSGVGSQHQGGSGGKDNRDDWKHIADTGERRKAQNRIAQRRYREKQRKETEEREAIAANTPAAGSQYQPPNAEDLASSQRELSGVPWGGLDMQAVLRAGQARAQQQQSQASPGNSSGGRGGGSASGGNQGTYNTHGGGQY